METRAVNNFGWSRHRCEFAAYAKAMLISLDGMEGTIIWAYVLYQRILRESITNKINVLLCHGCFIKCLVLRIVILFGSVARNILGHIKADEGGAK